MKGKKVIKVGNKTQSANMNHSNCPCVVGVKKGSFR